jgi:basic membrane protein A and related proteins
MRPLFTALALLSVVHGGLLFVRPPSASAPTAEATGTGPTVGVVFDMGGRGDKSFNDGAFLGADSAARLLAARVQFIEPGDGSDREAGLRLLAAERRGLVVGVGFIFTDDLIELAREYPDVNFAGVDFALGTDKSGNVIPPPANVAAIKFREEEGAFLVGAMAALVGGSKKLGFLGGMDIPLIHKFEAGYSAGVMHVCRDCTVIAQYAGVTPEAFRNPSKGKELSLSQYQQGVKVIFHASGSTGLGMFEAARTMGPGHYGIGVDADQYGEAPGYVLTSMIKGVNNVVYDTIRRVNEGTFAGGIYSYGLKEKGISYVYDANNKALIPDSVHTRLLELERQIIAGEIKVPSTRS